LAHVRSGFVSTLLVLFSQCRVGGDSRTGIEQFARCSINTGENRNGVSVGDTVARIAPPSRRARARRAGRRGITCTCDAHISLHLTSTSFSLAIITITWRRRKMIEKKKTKSNVENAAENETEKKQAPRRIGQVEEEKKKKNHIYLFYFTLLLFFFQKKRQLQKSIAQPRRIKNEQLGRRSRTGTKKPPHTSQTIHKLNYSQTQFTRR
jgi:hypothetical protein